MTIKARETEEGREMEERKCDGNSPSFKLILQTITRTLLLVRQRCEFVRRK